MDGEVSTHSEKMNGTLPKRRAASSRLPQYIATIIVNIAAFCNGMMLGWPSIAIPMLQSSNSPIGGEPLTNGETSFIASLVCLVAVVGIPLYNIIRTRFGNKITGYIIGLAYILGWIIIITTTNKICIYIARAVGGMGGAGIFALCPLYVSEIAEIEIRGTLGVFFILMFNVGYLFTCAIGGIISYQTIAIIGLVPPLTFLLCFWWLPETPAYLLIRGRTLEATRSLQWFRGKAADITEELDQMNTTLKNTDGETTMSFKEMLSDRGTRRGLIICVVLCINSQFCGIFAILSYLVNIFIAAGSSLSPNTASVIVCVLQLIGSFVASFLVDKTGRRLLMIVSNVSMAVCLAALGVFFYLKHIGTDVTGIGWLPVTSLSVYMVAIAIGLSPLPFVILTEISLPRAKKFFTTTGYCLIWGLAFTVGQCFTTLSDLLGIYGCYWFFSVSCILGAVFTYFVIPETKGRPVEDIHRELSGESGPAHEKDKKYVYTAAATEA